MFVFSRLEVRHANDESEKLPDGKFQTMTYGVFQVFRMAINVLELFSGIGGFHCALKELQSESLALDFSVNAAVDINEIANRVYQQNFPSTCVISKSVETISDKFLSKLDINLLVMSPPCQPFTRVGLKLDVADYRCEGLCHVIRCLELGVISPKWILLENVKGFEQSHACNLFTDCLSKLGYSFSFEFLHPFNFGVPNARLRCYILAVKSSNPLTSLLSVMELSDFDQCSLGSFLQSSSEVNEDYYLHPKTVSKYLHVADVVNSKSTHCMCFTKSYSRYFEGTGSLVLEQTKDSTSRELSGELKQRLLDESCRLRLFTEQEVLGLHSFPGWFSFPEDVTRKQRYKLLGNSLNVLVVKELLNHLLKF